jgi:hypothetical protein
MESGKLLLAKEIMDDFAYQTGISSDREQRRYLWTDAFAVCNFLGIYRLTGEEKYRGLALNLIYKVHHVLGKHRGDDLRKGWISGLDDEEGEKHPTIGGLRIGKELPERKPGESYDEFLEWYRDGQYYHYLTKWMHALNRASRETGDLKYNLWAVELAKKAHEAFVYEPFPKAPKRIYWKISIDLSRPLVTSMGQHDPLDGFLTYKELQATSLKDPGWPSLDREIADIERICEGMDWITEDPLGVGELLSNTYKAMQLISMGHLELKAFLINLLESSRESLKALRINQFRLPASCRLAFRELGLSIGLKAVKEMRKIVYELKNLFDDRVRQEVESILDYTPLSEKIEAFWLRNRGTASWREHEDVNMVMLATSLVPNGYLKI